MASDLYGVAAVIGAVGVAVPSIISAVVSVMNLNRGRHRDAKLETIRQDVNGLTGARVDMAMRAGTAEGHAQGVTDERNKPQVDAPSNAPPPAAKEKS